MLVVGEMNLEKKYNPKASISNCNYVIGYTENLMIFEDIAIISAIGTAIHTN